MKASREGGGSLLEFHVGSSSSINQSLHLAKGNVETTSQKKKTHQQPPARYLLEAPHDSLVGEPQLTW